MLCEKDTTSQLLTLFVKGESSCPWLMKSGIGSWRVTASVQKFLSQNGRLVSHDGFILFPLLGEVWINCLHDARHNFVMW